MGQPSRLIGRRRMIISLCIHLYVSIYFTVPINIFKS